MRETDLRACVFNHSNRYLRYIFPLLLGGTLNVTASEVPLAIDTVPCSKVREWGIDKQLNFAASRIRARCSGQVASQTLATMTARATPPAAAPGPMNVDLITGMETFPNVTQSESMIATGDGVTIVVNYNDSKDAGLTPANLSGISVSIDGGSTFTRLLPSPFASGHGTNFGDPVVVWNGALGMYFAGDLVSGCSGSISGIGLWTSPDGISWTPGVCAHFGFLDDRESMWADNNPASPYYGHMYISWNDASLGGALTVKHSSDGVIWSPLHPVSAGFIRDVQLTGSPDDGTVYLVGMDEGSGGFSPRKNILYKSTDGGDSWTTISMGKAFDPPGDSLCPAPDAYFPMIKPIWRQTGYGQPGAGPAGVVHYVYAGKGINPGDAGDIYYIKSTDSGETWSLPIVLNSDAALGGTHEQWMPSLSVTAGGKVQVSWYDRRDTVDGFSYKYYGILSPDNGVTWMPDGPISDVVIPQPEQPDPALSPCYGGDYNYHVAFGTTNYTTWTDGRIFVSGHSQQDVFFATIP